MGRLFWKFFALIWLAQLTAMMALGALFWVAVERRDAFRPAAIGPVAANVVHPAAYPEPGLGVRYGAAGRPPWLHTLPPPPALLATLAGSALTALLLALYVAKPIRSLRRAFDAVAAGDLDRRVSPEIGARDDELATLGRDFDRMAERLRSSMAGQRQLLHDVSHELRSPLARMQAAVGLLREEPERLAAMTDRIESEVARVDELVGELLTLSRLEAGELEAHQEEIDMHELVADIIQDVRFEAEASGSQIIWQEGEPAVIQGVPRLLHSAVENIVRNALKHAGTGSIRVETGATEGGTKYGVRVLDEGPGLAPAELERIFTPFFRGRSSAGSGHGLGLAIARRSVEAHGGTICASNRPGRGLCVEIVLRARTDLPRSKEL